MPVYCKLYPFAEYVHTRLPRRSNLAQLRLSLRLRECLARMQLIAGPSRVRGRYVRAVYKNKRGKVMNLAYSPPCASNSESCCPVDDEALGFARRRRLYIRLVHYWCILVRVFW
jgi:hypothetical protein